MKAPTTPYSIAIQETVKINREFLTKQGWELETEQPLFESYVHSKDSNLVCGIGLYGSFSISELHWCNKTPEKSFYTLNQNLTEDDYFTIIRLLNIEI